jgi:hypothetical protein
MTRLSGPPRGFKKFSSNLIKRSPVQRLPIPLENQIYGALNSGKMPLGSQSGRKRVIHVLVDACPDWIEHPWWRRGVTPAAAVPWGSVLRSSSAMRRPLGHLQIANNPPSQLVMSRTTPGTLLPLCDCSMSRFHAVSRVLYGCALLALATSAAAGSLLPSTFFGRQHTLALNPSGASLQECSKLLGTLITYRPPAGLSSTDDPLILPGSALSFGNKSCDANKTATFAVAKVVQLPPQNVSNPFAFMMRRLLSNGAGTFVNTMDFTLADSSPETFPKVGAASPTCNTTQGSVSLLHILFFIPRSADSKKFFLSLPLNTLAKFPLRPPQSPTPPCYSVVS